jgi:hypothetical protein
MAKLGQVSKWEIDAYKKHMQKVMERVLGFAPPLGKIVLLEAGMSDGVPDYVYCRVKAALQDTYWRTGKGFGALELVDETGCSKCVIRSRPISA